MTTVVQSSASQAPETADLAADLGERNVVDEHPELVARLTTLLEKYVADGRSAPGIRQKNTREVDIWRAVKATAK